jgi:hypothetical protein
MPVEDFIIKILSKRRLSGIFVVAPVLGSLYV